MKTWNYQPPQGAQINRGHPLARGIAGYWPLNDGGSQAADLSGNGNSMTLAAGNPTWRPGRDGLSFYANLTSYLANDTMNSTALKITGSLSISAWVNYPVNDMNTQAGGIVARDDTSTNRSYHLETTGASNELQFLISSDGTSSTRAKRVNNTSFNLNQWYHIVGVFDSVAQTMNFYTNGILDNGSLAGTVPTSIFAGNTGIRIGNDSRGGSGGNGDVKISNVIIYNRVLSAQDVQKLYISPYCFLYRKSPQGIKPLNKYPYAYDSTFYGSSFSAGPNYTSKTLNFGGWGDDYYDYLHFDLTGSPTAANTAQCLLNIHINNASVNDCVAQVNRVTSAWTASTLTRANTPTDDATNWGSLGSTAGTGWITADITTLYKDWKNSVYTNYGIKINPTVTTNQNNGSFDSVQSAYVPYLSITAATNTENFFDFF